MAIKSTRSFFIIGSENSFTKHFTERLSFYDKNYFDYHFEIGDWSSFFKSNNHRRFDAVIVEIYDNEEKINLNIRMTLFCKRSSLLKTIPFIALINTNDKLNPDSSLLFRMGFSYVHAYGDSIKLMCSNLYYMIYEDEKFCERWAMAKGFELSGNLYHDALVNCFNEEQIQILTDIQPTNYDDIKVNFFSDFNPEGFDPMENIQVHRVEGEFQQDLFVKYSDSWQTEGSPFFQDSLESWISLQVEKKEIQFFSETNILLYSESLFFYLNNFSDLTKTNTYHYETFKDESQLNEKISLDLIIFKITSEKSIHNFEALMLYLSEKYEANPIVIVIDHPSFTQALQKSFNYNQLIACTENIFKNVFSNMVSILKNKKINQSKYYHAKQIKNQYLASIPIPVKITSLTENEISFKTDHKIPFYTHLSINKPLNGLHLTVVPKYFDLSPNPNGYHYMGIINSISETTRQNLRRVVSHFIANPPKELSLIDLNKINVVEEVEKPILETKSESKKVEKSNSENIKRSKTKDKWSKL